MLAVLRKMRKIAIASLCIFAALALSLAFLAPRLASPYLKDLLLSAYAENFNSSLEIAELSIEPLLSVVKLKGVRIEDRGGHSAKAPLTIKEAHLSYSLLSLFSKTLYFKEIRLIEPAASASITETGSLDLVALLEPKKSTRTKIDSFRIALGAIKLKRGAFKLNYPQKDFSISIEQLSARSSLDKEHRLFLIELQTGAVIFGFGDRAARFDSITLKGSADAKGLEIKSSKLYRGKKHLAMSGRLLDFASGQTSIDFVLDADREFLALLFSSAPDFSGSIKVKGRAQGLLSSPEIKGEILAPELKLDGAVLSGLTGDLSYLNGRFAVDNSFGKIFGGDLKLRAEVDFADGNRRSGTPYKIEAEFSSARLEPILTMALKKGDAPVRATIAGELSLEGRIGDSSSFRAKGRIKLHDPGGEAYIRGWPFGRISALRASFNSTMDALQLERFALSGHGFEFKGDGGIDFQGGLSLTTQVKIDLAKAFEGREIPESLMGDFSFDGVTTGDIRNPSARGAFKANGFRLLRFETRASGELTVGLEGTRLKNVELWLDDSRYNVDASFLTAGIVRAIAQSSPALIIDALSSARVTLQRANIKSIVGRYEQGLPVQGIGSGAASIEGANGVARAEVKVEVKDGSIWGVGLDEFAGKLAISKTGVKFGPFETMLKTGRVSVGGGVDFDGRLGLELGAGPLELKKLVGYFYGPWALGGAVLTRGALRGTVAMPELAQTFTIQRANVYEEELRDLKGSISVNSEGLGIDGFEFRLAGGKVSGSGSYNSKAGLRVGFNAASIELQRLKLIMAHQVPLKGSMDAAGEIRLWAGELTGGANLRLAAGYILGQPIKGLTAKVELSKSAIRFQSIAGAIMNGAINGSGQYTSSAGLSLDISARGVELSELAPAGALKLPMSGRVDVLGAISANRDGLQARFTVEAKNFNVNGFGLSDFEAAGQLTGAGVRLSRVRAKAKGIPFEASGSFLFSGPYQFDLKVSKEAFENGASVPFSAAVEIAAGGDFGANGRPLRGQAIMRDIRSYGIGFGDSRAQFELGRGKVYLSGSALGRISYRAEISTAEGWPFKVEASVGDLSPGFLLKSLGLHHTEKIGGGIAGDIWIDGSFGELRSIAGRGLFKTFAVEVASYQFRNNGDLEVSLSGEGVKILKANFKGKDTDLSITGEATFNGKIIFQVNGASQLSILTAYLPYVQRAEGPVEVGLSIWGEARSPSLDGQMELVDNSLKFDFLEEPLKKISGIIKFDLDRILVPRIEAEFSGGKIEAFGSLSASGLSIERYNLSFSARNIALRYPQNLSSDIDAALRLHGAPGSQILSGRVLVNRSDYKSELDLKYLFLQYRAAGQVAPSGTPFDQINLDISLATVENLKAATNLANLEFKGDFNLRGTLGRPSLLGRAYIDRGEIFFRHKKFAIQQGIIDFFDPLKVTPYFDVKAETKIDKYLVTLLLAGTPDKFDLKLSSSPDLDEFSIITLITIGKTREEAFKNPDLLAATEAANLIGGQYKEDLEKRIEGALGLSKLELSPAYVESQKGVRPRVSLGKNITEDLIVSYSTNIGAYQEQQLQVEYKLTEAISLVGTKTEAKSTGIDLKFSFTFK